MKSWTRILFPVAVLSFVCICLAGLCSSTAVGAREGAFRGGAALDSPAEARDTVVYPPYGFKSALSAEELAQTFETELEDSLSGLFDPADTLPAKLSPRDSLKALLDSTLWPKLDSIYIADSTAKAKAKFDAWYASLGRKERRDYDRQQFIKLKMAQQDSIRDAKQRLQDERDSIIAETPRILETYALPDSLYYKRIVSWTVDQDFGRISAGVPDTSYNYHFYDYPFQRADVNASWLGVAGSPVQSYNHFLRGSEEGVDFYTPLESWSFSPRTLPNYNTKTPYTELCYYGPLLAQRTKESDNIHILTTQNVTPELNLTMLYDRFGGGGMLEKEKTANKTFALHGNYLGKKYTAHAGFIRNTINREENGGMRDIKWIRDTIVDSREIAVTLQDAKSKTQKNTFFLGQQYRIPFNFISKLRARRDSTYSFNPDSLDRDVTTAFIGHSSEFSIYTRKYTDAISDSYGSEFYHNNFRYGSSSADSMRVAKFDNKVYLRLQPWSSEAIVSKLDVGAGFQMLNYFDSTSVRPNSHYDNSFYIYGGAEGQLPGSFYWDANARLSLLGYNAGDFRIAAHGQYKFYPFRRARKSPIAIGAEFESTLQAPTWYQQHTNSNHYQWDNSFSRISTTSIRGRIDIPRWRLNASLSYALLAGNLYYDTASIIRQNTTPMSVLSADLRKEFVFGPLHLDNRALFQLSSDPSVLPLPQLALNLRYYFQFVVQKSEDGRSNVMVMQVGANAFYNTPWHSPAWNPNLGVFHNQSERLYTNGPYFDIFVNVQWKRACIFIKYQNAGTGWPMEKMDYFSADRYIITQNGIDGLKLGIFWPFYAEPKGTPSSSPLPSRSGSNSSRRSGSTNSRSNSSPGGAELPGRASHSGLKTLRR